jgi:N-succinyldiaminopimelate aminotransferase
MWERTLSLSSAGKSYSVTGWKVGWATGPAELVAALLSAKQWLTFTSGAPLQPAIAVALDDEPAWPRALARDLQARRDLLCDGLASLGLDVRRPEGTYFALSDISSLGWKDGMEFCLALPERAGVVAIPTQPFHDTNAGDQLVRWAFCKEASVIEEALTRLAAADLSA